MDKQRTLQQNKALHLYFRMLSEELNKAGLDMKKVLKPEVDIPWTPESVKNFIWRPVQKIMFSKESTTQLTKKEITEIFETIHWSFATKHFIDVHFPTEEQMQLFNKQQGVDIKHQG